MDAKIAHFVPPAPIPRTTPPSLFTLIRVLYKNPIEIWSEASYNEPYIITPDGVGGRILLANDPSLIHHILVSNVSNYKMAALRQKLLRPILREGLLTAEGEIWKRSRKAMAPVFTPKHIHGFAETMLRVTQEFADRYESTTEPVDAAQDMTQLTFEILAQTLFSGEIEGDGDAFLDHVELLFETAARLDPMDLLNAPDWLPRFTRIRGRKALKFFRKIVKDTVTARAAKMQVGENVPDDFMTLLLETEGKNGLSRDEIEDNVITFFGAGHETTARALGWTLYLLARAPHEREKVEQECDEIVASGLDPVKWLDAMPYTRAAFEEAMRLYPPAPTLSREAIADDQWTDANGETVEIKKGMQAIIMPWTLHRHRAYWKDPEAFDPSRFLPENRDKIPRLQYLPFGAGPRTCIGASFSLQEAVIALGVLLSRFRFDMTADAKEPWPVQKLTTQPDGGLRMNVTKR